MISRATYVISSFFFFGGGCLFVCFFTGSDTKAGIVPPFPISIVLTIWKALHRKPTFPTLKCGADFLTHSRKLLATVGRLQIEQWPFNNPAKVDKGPWSHNQSCPQNSPSVMWDPDCKRLCALENLTASCTGKERTRAKCPTSPESWFLSYEYYQLLSFTYGWLLV